MATVLIVEDDPVLLETLISAFEFLGFIAVGALNGLQAYYTIMDGLKPDIAFVDGKMPKMDGHTFMGYIRDELRLTFPIVATSASRSGFARADRVMPKPFGMLEIINTLKDLGFSSENGDWVHEILTV